MIKALAATALLLAFGAAALAKPTPVERPSLSLVHADINISSVGAMRENIGSVGAMREPFWTAAIWLTVILLAAFWVGAT